MLPRQADEEQPGAGVRPRSWTTWPSAMDAGDVDPGVVGPEPGRPHDRRGALDGAVVELDAVRRWSRSGAGRMVTPAWGAGASEVPMTRSPFARIRRARRESAVLVMTPSRVSHQNRSRPSSRCGSSSDSVPTASVTGGWWRARGRSAARSSRRRPRPPARPERGRGCGTPSCAAGPRPGRAGGQAGDDRRLERAGGDDDLVGGERALGGVHDVPAVGLLEPATRQSSRTGSSNRAAYAAR